MCKENLPYGQSNVYISQQSHKTLKYARAFSIFLIGDNGWLTQQKADSSKEKTTST